jgi:hypothetical protein
MGKCPVAEYTDHLLFSTEAKWLGTVIFSQTERQKPILWNTSNKGQYATALLYVFNFHELSRFRDLQIKHVCVDTNSQTNRSQVEVCMEHIS